MKRLSIAIILSLALTNLALAAEENIDVPKCSLGVFPFNPSAASSYGATGNNFIEILSGFKIGAKNLSDKFTTVSQAECKNRITYGASHVQGVATLKNFYKDVLSAADKLQKVPRAIHEHTYINTSLQDTKYYKSLIFGFEISLENDGVNNTKLDELQCTTPVPAEFSGNASDLLDCDGYVSNLYGGTKITKTTTGSDIKINWKFGVNSNGDYIYTPGDLNTGINDVPYTIGNNSGITPGLKNLDSSADLSNPMSPYRIFRPHVTMTSKDGLTDEFWSTTTTSRVLLRNYEINAPSIVRDGVTYSPNGNFSEFLYITCKGLDQPDTGWCPSKVNGGEGSSISVLNTSNNQTSTRGRLFWFDIGSVATIWQQPATPPPSELACADLQWDGAFKKKVAGIWTPDTTNPNGLLPDEEAIMKFKTIHENGLGPKRPLEYQWVAFYGQQNEPAWFKNEGTILFVPIILNQLPQNLIKVAHAALPPIGTNIDNNGLSAADLSINPAITALLSLGGFKDEYTSAFPTLVNPMTDTDNQAYYSGGSEGVTLGVQAFYTDGKVIAGQGPEVDTPSGKKQKAVNCHLELDIEPAPATCIDLTIDPSSLKPNTPVTFTVTPKFTPAGKTIPLNYQWNAEKYNPLDLSPFNPGSITPNPGGFNIDPGLINLIPGTGTNNPAGSSAGSNWWGNGLGNIGNLGTGLGSLFDPCDNIDCNQYAPVDPWEPVMGNSIEEIVGSPVNANLGINLGGNLNQDFGNLGGFGATNIFAEYGKAALPGININEPLDLNSSGLGSSIPGLNTIDGQTGTGENGYGADPVGLKPSAPGIGNLGPAINNPDFSIDPDLIDALEDLFKYGGFKDAESSTFSPVSPYLEKTDNKTWYTGGPGGTKITVQAKGKDGKIYPLCKETLIIPESPDAKCQQLKVKYFDGNTEVNESALVTGKSYRIEIDKANSKRSDDTPIQKFSLHVANATGAGLATSVAGNPAGCSAIVPKIGGFALIGTSSPTSVDCKYNYTPKAGDKLTLLADPHDNVAACRIDKTFAPEANICKALNLTTTPLLIGKQIPLNTQVALVADPRDTANNPRQPIVYEKKGAGAFIINVTNASSCPVPSNAAGIVTFEAPSSCKYSFIATTSAPGDYLKVKVKQDDNVAACTETLTIAPPGSPICQSLNLTTSPLIPGNEFGLNQNIKLTTDPKDTNGASREPVVYLDEGDGYFIADPTNAASCPTVPAENGGDQSFEAESSCKYSYQSPAGLPSSGKRHFSVKVKQDDGVSACKQEFELKVVPEIPEKCLSLNLKVNGSNTLNPLLIAGQSYALQTDPITDQGNPIVFVEWTETGSGKLLGQFGNPAICPAIIDNGSVVTPAFCRYIYASPDAPSNTNGFSVRAVPDDGVANCKAKSDLFTPPQSNPYCLYLDLDYQPQPFQTSSPTSMDATVVMSDGSKYNDKVRFTSSDSSGNFSGGISPVGNGSSDFRSMTDSNNNTSNVSFSGGSKNTSINIFLSDTSVVQTAACQRRLNPVIIPDKPPVCEEPPRIERDGNKFCAEVTDLTKGSDSYCWSISGSENPIFTNGSNKATGKCVTLDENYSNFDLKVEDCNPKFRDYCYDSYEKEDTPTIEKRISKDSSPARYGTQINYSTKGDSQTQTVKYLIEYTPANYRADGSIMVATIYDPAFTGKLQGYKTGADGAGSKTPGGTIDFGNIENTIKINQGFTEICGPTTKQNEKCYFINKSQGSLMLQNITSDDKITIEYSGKLQSGITLADCRNGIYCNEQFINQSFVTDMRFCYEDGLDADGNKKYRCEDENKPGNQKCEYFYNDKGERYSVNGHDRDCEMPRYTIVTDRTVAELVCQYFLTRASGDIFLEDDLQYGIDVSKCYPFKNSSSTIIKPVNPIDFKAPKTGTPEIVSISHEICSAGQNQFTGLKLAPDKIKALTELFGSDVSSLSSQICEVGLVPGSDWDKSTINSAITKNIGKLTRWANSFNPSPNIFTINDLDSSVYYYNGELGGVNTVTIDSLQIPEGSGAHTIIVENADLLINGNIEYSSGTPALNSTEIASLGVIVLNGNLYIAPEVETLSGAYFVQRNSSEDLDKGNIISGSPEQISSSDKFLTIYGSMYGNIGPLFENRNAAGDVSKDEGAITIRYDQRIIQNPPAGLSEILGDLSQGQIAQ